MLINLFSQDEPPALAPYHGKHPTLRLAAAALFEQRYLRALHGVTQRHCDLAHAMTDASLSPEQLGAALEEYAATARRANALRQQVEAALYPDAARAPDGHIHAGEHQGHAAPYLSLHK